MPILTYRIKLLIIACCIMLAGCEPHSGAAKLDNYLNRLSRALQIDIPNSQPVQIPAYPSRRSRLQSISKPKSDITLIDFLKLDHCQLGQIIANKNSSLGKVANTSQQLFSELAYLQHAPACIKHLDKTQQTSLRNKVAYAQRQKIEYLPELLWLALLGESEYAQFWQLPVSLGDYPQSQDIETTIALETLYKTVVDINNNEYDITIEQQQKIELALSTLRRGNAGYFLKHI